MSCEKKNIFENIDIMFYENHTLRAYIMKRPNSWRNLVTNLVNDFVSDSG
jgi:hypothetical protein